MLAGINPKQYVGHRHHLVPRFILQRFANDRDQVWVRDRATGHGSLRNIRDLAIKDFYTFIDKAGELDSSYESMFGVVEGVAADVLRSHMDQRALVRARPFDQLERMAIDSLVAMQAVRGHEHRRVGEVLADYFVKLTHQHELSEEDLTELFFVPHQNEHLKIAIRLAPRIHRHLERRACFLVTLDRPLLITCDEPILLHHDEERDQFTQAQLNDIPRGVVAKGVAPEDLIRITGPNATGLAEAQAVVMPVSPRHAIVYDEPGTAGPAPHRELADADADTLAAYVVEYCIENSYAWLAAHPDHRGIQKLRLPRRRPPLIVIDGGTPMSRQLQRDERRMAHRLDKKAKPTKTEEAND